MSYTPCDRPMPSLNELERKCHELMTAYKEHLKLVNTEYSEKARLEYMANPKTIVFMYEGKTEEQNKADGWNREKEIVMESSARKKKRMEDARIQYEVEIGFQAQHCVIRAETAEGNLSGYYKVTRHPTHYSFVLKRNLATWHPLPIGKETILPITLDMSGPDWSDVTPAKIHTP